MLHLFLTYWWVALPVAGVAAFYALRFWAERKFESVAEDILRETQTGFAAGKVEMHSVTVTGTTTVEDETATLYDIDATITPTDETTEWAGSDLFLWGVDEDGDEDPMRIGEVRRLQRWTGSSFEPIKKRAGHVGTERLVLSIRFAGSPGPVRFNYNFACFGPVFDLPECEAEVSVTS